MDIDLQQFGLRDLLALQGHAVFELQRRNIVRSDNSPVGDYAELLCAKALGATRSEPDWKGYDLNTGDLRYQVKGRRLTARNQSRQVGALRDLDNQPFDFLAVVLFNENYSVRRACVLPHDMVLRNSTRVERTNSWKFLARDIFLNSPDTRDITDAVRRVEAELNGTAAVGATA